VSFPGGSGVQWLAEKGVGGAEVGFAIHHSRAQFLAEIVIIRYLAGRQQIRKRWVQRWVHGCASALARGPLASAGRKPACASAGAQAQYSWAQRGPGDLLQGSSRTPHRTSPFPAIPPPRAPPRAQAVQPARCTAAPPGCKCLCGGMVDTHRQTLASRSQSLRLTYEPQCETREPPPPKPGGTACPRRRAGCLNLSPAASRGRGAPSDLGRGKLRGPGETLRPER
jgi:hypothetical protein